MSRTDVESPAKHARDPVLNGRLPARPANRTFGGPGSGATCAVCGEPVASNQMELEIEFNRHGATPGLDCYHLHTKCFAAWELKRTKSGAE